MTFLIQINVSYGKLYNNSLHNLTIILTIQWIVQHFLNKHYIAQQCYSHL